MVPTAFLMAEESLVTGPSVVFAVLDSLSALGVTLLSPTVTTDVEFLGGLYFRHWFLRSSIVFLVNSLNFFLASPLDLAIPGRSQVIITIVSSTRAAHTGPVVRQKSR